MTYGLNLFGNIRVFRKEKEIKGQGKKTYVVNDIWFNVSEKEEDGSYYNKSMNLLFKKGLDLPVNNQVIKIVEAFPVITGNGEYRRIAWMVGQWEPVEQQ